MNVAAFVVVAFMLAMYVLLDGYDLGVGAISVAIAHTSRERSAAMESIGPFWNGNEVWLIAAGAALFALFPAAYASSFSGFYLPFILVLWLLMFRGIALELREHFSSELWRQFWDACFFGSSALLALLFGISLGNLLRGLPLDASGYFAGTFASLLNPYALLVGCFALLALCVHGAAFAMLRIEGEPARRARRVALRLWWLLFVLYVCVSAFTYLLRGHPSAWIAALGMLPVAALALLRPALVRNNARAAFAWSSCFLAALLTLSAATLFPYLLPDYPPSRGGLSIYAAAPPPAALVSALVVTIGGTVVVLLYASVVWKRMAGKIRVE